MTLTLYTFDTTRNGKQIYAKKEPRLDYYINGLYYVLFADGHMVAHDFPNYSFSINIGYAVKL